MNLDALELGKRSAYQMFYNSKLLFPIPRSVKRLEIGIDLEQALPFYGFDNWNHYEVSWLNAKGKPMVAIANIHYDCHSPNIIESKSMKLYFNSFNHTFFEHPTQLVETIKTDIAANIEYPVEVTLHLLSEAQDFMQAKTLSGSCIDTLDVTCQDYEVNANLLQTTDSIVEETLYSNLLKSNCLVTLQPDWGSVEINYKGRQICHESLLKYIVSFRNHNEFHEQCIERVFIDIIKHCQPEKLTVYGRYTRRGGVDINPLRTTEKHLVSYKPMRLVRQ